MRTFRLLPAIVLLGFVSGCVSLPKTRADVKAIRTMPFKTQYQAPLSAVMDSYLLAAEKCGKEWRRWAATSFGWASAPVYKSVSDSVANQRSAALEIWGTHPMFPDYLLQLFEMHEDSDGATEVVHYRLPTTKKPATPMATHTESWYPPGNANCW